MLVAAPDDMSSNVPPPPFIEPVGLKDFTELVPVGNSEMVRGGVSVYVGMRVTDPMPLSWGIEVGARSEGIVVDVMASDDNEEEEEEEEEEEGSGDCEEETLVA